MLPVAHQCLQQPTVIGSQHPIGLRQLLHPGLDLVRWTADALAEVPQDPLTLKHVAFFPALVLLPESPDDPS